MIRRYDDCLTNRRQPETVYCILCMEDRVGQKASRVESYHATPGQGWGRRKTGTVSILGTERLHSCVERIQERMKAVTREDSV